MAWRPAKANLWHPDTILVPAAQELWGDYRGNTPPRGVLHTTETDYYPPSTKSYFGHKSWPHSTIGEAKDGRRGIFGHIPINRAARALKNPAGGVETNAAHAVQCEIVWRAGNAAAMPDWLLDLVASWMRYVEATVGVQRTAATFYGQNAGFTVASVNAKQRMTAAQWNTFNGWCGHQHVPENDHWDPGAIPIDRLLNTATSPHPQPPTQEDDDMAHRYGDKTGNDKSQVLVDGPIAVIIKHGDSAAALDEGNVKTILINPDDYRDIKARATNP